MRPGYDYLFDHRRRLAPYFHTSNIDKLAQAQFVFSKYGHAVKHFKSDREPYEERAAGTRELLTCALDQVSDEFGVRATYFVEDTSLRIDALSGAVDFPGTDVKHWFDSVTFEELDEQIRAAGADRRAIVMSDIALKLPTHREPIFFHGETIGTVATSPPTFEQNPIYGWLSPETFNGWVVPANGDGKRLGEMEVEESLEFDFRAKSLASLVKRLNEYNAVANLPRFHFSVARAPLPEEPRLPFVRDVVGPMAIIGPTCAGKTTAGDILRRKKKFRVFEASGILREAAAASGVTIDSGDDAMRFLRERGMGLVAERFHQIADSFEDLSSTAVTGLRTVEEVLYLRARMPDLVVVAVEADEKSRFLRHVRRGRAVDPRTLADFKANDLEQGKFGLLRLARDVADYTISNEGTLEEYEAKLLAIPSRARPGPIRHASELARCLSALQRITQAATCEEISVETITDGAKVRKYNTNRALKSAPEFARRIKKGKDLLRYKITRRGTLAVRLLQETQKTLAAAE